MKDVRKRLAFPALCLALILAAAARLPAQNQPQRPPEYNELVAASQIKDAAARLQEFERIKAAYPASRYMAGIDRYIYSAKVELASSLDGVLAIQKDLLAAGIFPIRVQGPFAAANQILTHPRLKSFDKAAVLAAVLSYRDSALKIFAEAGGNRVNFAGRGQDLESSTVTRFAILVAQAYLNAEDTAKASTALEAYKKEGGASDGVYFYTLGATLAKMNRNKEALDAYLSAAAADNGQEALAAARDLYARINGKAEGFEAALEAKLKALPYEPEPFKAPLGWKGRTVLAELFTGSECPPCIAADLGFDGLIETYPAKYLAVLEYHLPIPRPDPMMNAATRKRQDYYGVGSTPTVVIDGEKDTTGGGPRGRAETKFKEYKAAIDGHLAEAPAAELKVKAVRAGDVVTVDFAAGRAVPGAEYNLVLVQAQERYQGSNGLMFHKMVVRDLLTVDPTSERRASFDLADSERQADQYLTDFESTSKRFQGFKFAERHHKIDRGRLRVVLFAQDGATKKVLNAVVADVT